MRPFDLRDTDALNDGLRRGYVSLCRRGKAVNVAVSTANEARRMEFRILGPLEVISDGQIVELGGAKQRALLAVLLLNANEVVSLDRLIDALWENDPPENAQNALQVHVFGLRKLIGRERLETVRGAGYRLRDSA